MLFVCKRCNFKFNRTERPDACPNCGCELINEINEEEQKENEKLKKENKSK